MHSRRARERSADRSSSDSTTSHDQEAPGRRCRLQGLAVIKPRAIVCLGATAAQVLIGPKFRVSTQRATFVKPDLAPFVTATVHPSSILRAPSDEQRRVETTRFIADLKKIRKALG